MSLLSARLRFGRLVARIWECTAAAPPSMRGKRSRSATSSVTLNGVASNRRSVAVRSGLVTVNGPKWLRSVSVRLNSCTRIWVDPDSVLRVRAGMLTRSGLPGPREAPQIQAAERYAGIRPCISHGASAASLTRGLSGHPTPRSPGPHGTRVPRICSAERNASGHKSKRGGSGNPLTGISSGTWVRWRFAECAFIPPVCGRGEPQIGQPANLWISSSRRAR